MRSWRDHHFRTLLDPQTGPHGLAHLAAAVSQVSCIFQKKKNLLFFFFTLKRNFINFIVIFCLSLQKPDSRRNHHDQPGFHFGEEEAVQVVSAGPLICDKRPSVMYTASPSQDLVQDAKHKREKLRRVLL